MSMRDEFEKWYASKNDGFCPTAFKGEYDFADAQMCWEAWQAAQAPASGEVEPVARIESISPMDCTAVVRWMPEQNGLIPQAINRIGTELFAHPPASQVPEGWREAALGAKRFADDPKMVLAQPQTAAAHIRGLADLILTTPGNAAHPQPAQQGSVPEEAVSLARKWLGITESSLLHNDDITKMAEALLATSQPANQGVPEGWSLTHIDDPATDGYLVKGPGISYCAWKDKEPWLYLFCEALATTPQPEGDGWIEPDLMWDAESPEESCRDSAFEFAEDRASDMPSDETMVVNVMCAKELPSRQMKIWVDENDDLQWEWITPPTAQGGEGDE